MDMLRDELVAAIDRALEELLGGDEPATRDGDYIGASGEEMPASRSNAPRGVVKAIQEAHRESWTGEKSDRYYPTTHADNGCLGLPGGVVARIQRRT